MKRSPVVILLALLFVSPFLIAEKANFELAEKWSTDHLRRLVGSHAVSPHWLHDSDRFWYRYKTNSGTGWFLVDPEARRKSPLFDNQELAGRINALIGKAFNPVDLPIEKLEFAENNREFSFKLDDRTFVYDLAGKELKLAEKTDPEEDQSEVWKHLSPDKKWIVFARDHNLYLLKADDESEQEIRLTGDGERWYSYAREAAEDKPGERVPSAAVWFKSSDKLWVHRLDNRKVGDLFLVHSLSRPRPTLQTYKYPMPGESNMPVHELLVFDVATHERVVIETGKWPTQAVGLSREEGVYTAETSDRIWFTRRDRTWSKVEFCVADTASGVSRILLAEESRPYFYYLSAQCRLINNGAEFIWWSERDNWGRFYLYDGEGRLKNPLTDGPFHSDRILEVDAKSRVVYFLGYGKQDSRDPYFQHYYRVGLDGGGLKHLTPEDASHSFAMCESRRYFVDTYSRVDSAPVSVLRDNQGTVVMNLEAMDTTLLEQAGWKPPEAFRVKAADGVTDLYGVMWKPFDFDPEKSYPVIVYCYPGPQSEPVPKTFFLLRDQRVHNLPLAQLGFIVVTVGQRGGSPYRSKWYHTYGYGNARDYPLADNKSAVEQLARRHPWMDIENVGIYGRSGGGFMSAAALLAYPDFYKAAFSSCGNHDNLIYSSTWGELHYGVKPVEKTVKDEKGERIENVFEPDITTNPELAANLKGKLMLIHGEVDDNVHPANTLRLADALIKAGKRFDMMIFPGKKHAFGETTRYIERMMWYFFAEHLMGDVRTNTDIYNR